MTPDLAVIAVSHNSAADLPGFTASLGAASRGLSVCTVMVDNASHDDSVDVARSLGIDCVVVADNDGYAAGINRGRAVVGSGPPILVANLDVRFSPGAVGILLAAMQAGGGVCVPRVVDSDGMTRRSLRREPTMRRQLGEAVLGDHLPGRSPKWSIIMREPGEYSEGHAVDWATGAVLLIPQGCDRAVGDWDEEYFLYSEEVDFCSRARHAGFPIHYVPEAVVFHSEGGSGRSAGLVALDAVNRVRYFRQRNGALPSYVFGALILLEKALRSSDPAERLAARAIVRSLGPSLAKDEMPDGRRLLASLNTTRRGHA